MALQSQTLRGSGSNIRSSTGSLVASRKNGQKRLVGMVLLVLLLGGGFIWLVKYRDSSGGMLGPQSARAENGAANNSLNAIVPPTKEPIAAAPIPKPEPTILEMGAKARPSTQPSTPSTALPAMTAATKPNPAPITPATHGTPLPLSASPPPATTPLPGTNSPQTPSGVRDPLNAPGSTPSTTTAPVSTTPPAMPPSAEETSTLPGELAAVQTLAERAVNEKRLVEARTQLNKILVDPRVSDRDREGVRRWMADLNKDLVFSAMAYPGDPMVETYKVEKGDSPIKINRKMNTMAESGLIQRINGVNPSNLKIGQQLKIVKGPFHAVVSKSAFRMDIYAGPTPATIGSSGLGGGAEAGWVYIRSFPVGLGANDGTPIGAFKVKENSKLVNPPWTNPRTGEKFGADDAKNPIGERWIGLVGVDEKTKSAQGYGIHATIVPESIGKEMSMGCVRMNEEDVEVVYDLLMTGSVVKIVP